MPSGKRYAGFDTADPSPTSPQPGEALGQSEAFLAFQERLSRVAPIGRPVLIVGERGTGKELAAKRLHYLSKRWDGPLVELNCAALAPTLIETELFGHEPGAFTGAAGRRQGRFEAADGGTLFLDELGNIPVEVQEKILRVVEYGVFERVGGTVPVHADVRIIGATNADLPRLADEGRFMRDLLDRLSFEVLHVPPLRERGEDILLLANHFAARMAFEMGREAPPEFAEEAIRGLESHPWRGNVRELKNVVERAVYQSHGHRISRLIFDPFAAEDQPAAAPPAAAPPPAQTPPAPARAPETSGFPPEAPLPPLKEAQRELERRLLREALARARFNQRAAARLLGLSYHQFRGLYRKHPDIALHA